MFRYVAILGACAVVALGAGQAKADPFDFTVDITSGETLGTGGSSPIAGFTPTSFALNLDVTPSGTVSPVSVQTYGTFTETASYNNSSFVSSGTPFDAALFALNTTGPNASTYSANTAQAGNYYYAYSANPANNGGQRYSTYSQFFTSSIANLASGTTTFFDYSISFALGTKNLASASDVTSMSYQDLASMYAAAVASHETDGFTVSASEEVYNTATGAVISETEDVYQGDMVAVPEPASITVLGFGLIGLTMVARRRRSA